MLSAIALRFRLIHLRHLGYHLNVADVLDMTVRCDELAPATVRAKLKGIPGLGSARGDAMLVASELVTNAVCHSLCAEDDLLSVRITRDGRLRISVLDPGASGRSAEIVDRPIEVGGLGLKVVDELAANWGTERRNDGYRVWAELELHSQTARHVSMSADSGPITLGREPTAERRSDPRAT